MIGIVSDLKIICSSFLIPIQSNCTSFIRNHTIRIHRQVRSISLVWRIVFVWRFRHVGRPIKSAALDLFRRQRRLIDSIYGFQGFGNAFAALQARVGQGLIKGQSLVDLLANGLRVFLVHLVGAGQGRGGVQKRLDLGGSLFGGAVFRGFRLFALFQAAGQGLLIAAFAVGMLFQRAGQLFRRFSSQRGRFVLDVGFFRRGGFCRGRGFFRGSAVAGFVFSALVAAVFGAGVGGGLGLCRVLRAAGFFGGIVFFRGRSLDRKSVV